MLLFAHVVNSGGMSLTIEQVVTQLQQEVITLEAQVADQEAARAINNCATAQFRNDAPKLTDVKGLGRSKEFAGKEEDYFSSGRRRRKLSFLE